MLDFYLIKAPNITSTFLIYIYLHGDFLSLEVLINLVDHQLRVTFYFKLVGFCSSGHIEPILDLIVRNLKTEP